MSGIRKFFSPRVLAFTQIIRKDTLIQDSGKIIDKKKWNRNEITIQYEKNKYGLVISGAFEKRTWRHNYAEVEAYIINSCDKNYFIEVYVTETYYSFKN